MFVDSYRIKREGIVAYAIQELSHVEWYGV